MKSLKYLLFIIILVLSDKLFSQTDYYAGTSRVSIEPDQTLLSLHLGGYGLPRDGRFTLEWSAIGSLSEVNSLGISGDKMYIISKNELFRLNLENTNVKWEKSGPAEGIIAIAGVDGKMYGINAKGDLLETSLQGGIRWKKSDKIDNTVSTLAASEGYLYAANNSGSIWTADLSKKNLEWKKSESLSGIINLAANNGILYAVTSEGGIYKCAPSGGKAKWLIMAYRNGETIKEDINHIAVMNDRLYGISRSNILYLGGHRSEGNLSCRAMAIKNGAKTVVIINIDVCGLDDEFTGVIKDVIFEKTGIPGSAVFINSSHTHFAPVSQNWLTWQEANQKPDSIYLNHTIRNGLISSVEKALGSMEPAELYFGRGQTDIGYNRSLKDHPELYDSGVDVIKVVYPKKGSESYLFMAACHPVFSTAGTLHYTISANYPGIARQLIERRTGTANSLFLQGTAGDINPRDNGEHITGEKLANEVIAVLKRPMEKIIGPISFFIDTVNVPITPWTRDEIKVYKEANITKTADVYAEKNVKWSDLILKYYDEGTMPSSLPVYVQTFNIGNWKLVGFSREATTEYGFGVKNMWPGKLVSVAGYTNDVSSYLPTQKHLEAKNYEGLDSFFWYGSPAVFPLDVYDIILKDIKEHSR